MVKDLNKLSRSKLEIFLRCPRCFYLDQKYDIRRPEFPAFTLNSAVDHLLKKEFDVHRVNGTAHPIMHKYRINARPFNHPDLAKWRHNFTGVRFFHQPSNFLVYGAIDDLWLSEEDGLLVVDYKATSKDSEINLDGVWQQAYKHQVEIYQWLLRRNGFQVSDTAYFVYVNGRRDRPGLDGKLEFDMYLLPYRGSDVWVEAALLKARQVLAAQQPPPANRGCEYCRYRRTALDVEKML